MTTCQKLKRPIISGNVPLPLCIFKLTIGLANARAELTPQKIISAFNLDLIANDIYGQFYVVMLNI